MSAPGARQHAWTDAPNPFGDGFAAERIVEIIGKQFERSGGRRKAANFELDDGPYSAPRQAR